MKPVCQQKAETWPNQPPIFEELDYPKAQPGSAGCVHA